MSGLLLPEQPGHAEYQEQEKLEGAWTKYVHYDSPKYEVVNARRWEERNLMVRDYGSAESSVEIIGTINVSDTGAQVLEHDYSPDSPQFELEQRLQSYFANTPKDQQAVIVEGSFELATFSSRDEAVQQGAEAGLTSYLGKEQGVQVIGGDPTEREAYGIMEERGVSRVDLTALKAIRGIAPDRRRGEGADTLVWTLYNAAVALEVPGFNALSDEDKSPANAAATTERVTKQVAMELLPRFNALTRDALDGKDLFAVEDRQIKLNLKFDPNDPEDLDSKIVPLWHPDGKSQLSALWRVNAEIRDRYLFEKIVETTHEGKHPFVVFGGPHLVSLEPVLEQYFGGGEANISEVYALLDQLHSSGDNASRYQLRRRVRAGGTDLANEIIGMLDTDEIDQAAAYNAIALCATSTNAEAIARRLPLPMPDGLAQTMERIATSDIAPLLSSRLDEIAHSESGVSAELYNQILRIAIAGQNRHADQADVWEDIIARCSTGIAAHGFLDVQGGHDNVNDYIEQLRTELDTELIALRYAELFYYHGDDPDFGQTRRSGGSLGKGHAQERSADERVQTVKNLFALVEERLGDDSTGQMSRVLEIMAYHEKQASPLAIKLGVEVEILRKTLKSVAPAVLRLSADELDEAMYQRLGDFRRTEQAGVPSDSDEFWEFSHAPSRHFQTPTLEVQALMHLNLINPEYTDHPMHITLGGVTSEGTLGREAFVLSHVLEGTGWTTDAERIRQPHEVTDIQQAGATWLSKGVGGLNERNASQQENVAPLQGGDTVGIEMRVMNLKSLSGLSDTLRTAYGLGSALRAYQTVNSQSESVSDADQQALAEIWGEFSAEAVAFLAEHNFAHPADWKASNSYGKHPETSAPVAEFRLDNNFLNLAANLEQAGENPRSQGGIFVEHLQQMAVTYASKALAVLERTVPSSHQDSL